MSLHIPRFFFLFVSIKMAIIPSVTNRVALAHTPETMFTSNRTKLPGCIQECGDVIIRYPFGIGPECALNDWFSITCNKTTSEPPRAFLNRFPKFDILNITETEVVIQNDHIATKCYDSQGKEITALTVPWELDISESPFTLSNTSNSLTVIGYNDFGLMGVYGKQYALYYMSGCITVYTDQVEVKPESCSGLGCCQTSIPSGLQHFQIDLYKLENRPKIETHLNYCSYAFFAKHESFTFDGASDLKSGEHLKSRAEHVPFALSWAFDSNISCREANESITTYLCQANAECVDSEGKGYRCRCRSGYEAHPYPKPGCRDINECAGSYNPCGTNMTCHNTEGSYTCKEKINMHKDHLIIILFALGLPSGTILLLLAASCLQSFMKKRKKSMNFKRNGGFLLQQQVSNDGSVVERTKIFNADELDIANGHFNQSRILGEGGHGTVYKGMLSEGRVVAIKKSNTLEKREVHQFINEIIILSQINHRHIVKLLGCCLETEVPLLVYEFIPNETLFHHIHCPRENFPITWKMRLQIAYDSAGALDYLHTLASDLIVHRDIKSSNILLNDKYQAKIADFGFARIVPIDKTHVTSVTMEKFGFMGASSIVGTFGYLDPEYFVTGKFTQKSDVYSFGVVLVELLTSQKAIRTTLSTISQEDESLRSWFYSHMYNNNLLNIIDSKILQEGSTEEFHAFANLAGRCLDLEGKNRPTMKQVQQEIDMIRSRHFPQTNEKMESKFPQELIETETYGPPSFSTSLFHDSFSSSAEASLLFNSH